MDLGLRDRVYLVTGGSRGLGFATARVLVEEGARVVLSSRDEGAVSGAAAELGGSERAIGIVADNADDGAATRLVATAVARWDRLDGGLISVGGPPGGEVAKVLDAQWRAAFDSVFLGALRMARAIADTGGDDTSIAFVLSTSTKAPIPGLAISNGLRPGLGMLAKSLADELGPRGVRVNGLMPGRIATDRIEELDGARGDAKKVRRQQEKAIPLRRYGEPEEFGRVAAFLLSPAASYLTGAMVPVEGGALRSL